MLPKLTLVLGGAASGKSRYAEELVVASGLPRVYVATAQVWDDEMADKVAAHLDQRGPDWTTVEAPQDLAEALRDVPEGAAVLVDCATMWLSNLMLAEVDLDPAFDDLAEALGAAKGPVVIVTNEVGHGIVPENALARRFREAQGRLNQRLAAQADLAVLVVAGLPLVLKGELP